MRIEGVRHVFPNGHEALKSTDIHVEGGSFCTLLGPSGSGKTTLLRIIAGLLDPTGGRVLIGDRDVTGLAVQQRSIGFVFQHYALFPHLTAKQNIEYPLRIRNIDAETKRRRVNEILDLVELRGFADRRPDQLSGGQQQRVAVGRALVYEPNVLLLDEPLGALDRKLRQQLGADLRRIQQETDTTAIYVTHDQDEAFILSDSVVVMDHGQVLQQGRPDFIYERPTSMFVAGFLGEVNVISGTLVDIQGDVALLETDQSIISCPAHAGLAIGNRYGCTVRPEDLELSSPDGVSNANGSVVYSDGTVVDTIFLGSRFRVVVDTGAQRFVAEASRSGVIPPVGATVAVSWRAEAGVLVDLAEQAG